MHGKIATCLCAMALAMPVRAQSATSPTRPLAPADAIKLQTVTVTGPQPGPGLWKVSKGDHVLWVLGTLTPLPRHIQWQSAQVEQVISQSQELLEPPTAELKMDERLFNQLALQPSVYSARKNPDGANLQQVLPQEMFARWQALKQQYIGNDRGIEYWRPMLVAIKLYDKALDSAGLTPTSEVSQTVLKLARKHHVKRTPVIYQMVVERSHSTADALKQTNLDDISCFNQTMDTIEHDLGAFTTRADAWAKGDMATLRSLSLGSRYKSCIVAVVNADFSQQLGLHDLPERIDAAWLSAAQYALMRNAQTFALLPVEQALAPDGLLAKLKADGYIVQSPDEQGQ
ncbi:TraB/GumN family protein [Dyella tabacisoli]|uniref:TraB/GumN family protein n=1 Tax=Dyella tabacisoli TaxID=2282381 RepID=A0A369UR03_9GAMM|nr:TraB/GumN family protein [Dyella tabacisoli]RDD82743.1 TraB/GumN family protein [Dyella tabacisoli]